MWRFAAALLLVSGVAKAGVPAASSELKDASGVRHSAERAFDGLLQTAWSEGDSGPGVGSWVELRLDRPTDVASVSLWPGNLSEGTKSLREYGRPRRLTVTLTTSSGPVSQEIVIEDLALVGPRRVDVPVAGTATVVRVSVDEAYGGPVFDDTGVAEIAINFVAGEVPDAVERALKWQGTSAAESAAERNKTQIVKWFDAVKSAEVGGTDVLSKIMDQAGDGAPFMRERAKNVPLGFRMHALPPDDVAVEALLKLKDANAISAIELAALRVTGKEQKELSDKVDYFYAYQELIGGGSLNVSNWGQSGWEEGALRSFGEPAGLAVDQFGELYVADLANHRIQRFDGDGKSTRSWGGEAAITNRWFAGTRRYYVSGGEPGEKPGQFVTPVDIVMLPGKHADGFAVLDGRGRVQIFDEAGDPVVTWAVRSEAKLKSGVGGEGYLVLLGSRLAVIWGEEAFIYGREGEELAAWTIADGAPSGAVALPGGKLGLIVEDELVAYTASDGFRHGNILEGDERGVGFEDWDVALDEKGKLWAVTDTGVSVKYKRPGVVDYRVNLADELFVRPRIAVSRDVVYVLEQDHIQKFDALLLKAKAELVEEEGR